MAVYINDVGADAKRVGHFFTIGRTLSHVGALDLRN